MSVLITGAGGAIGAACVQAFLDRGDRVIAQDLDAAAWDATDRVITVAGDLLDPVVLERIDGIAGADGLSAVVAAHGIAGSAALGDCDDAFIERVIRINWSTIPALFGVVEPHLRRSSGAFVAVASQAALIGEAENAAYCAAKFAVNGWARAQAAVARGYTVHSLCPGATESPLLIAAQRKFASAQGVTPEAYYQQRTAQISLGRYGQPGEIAAAAHYLTERGPRPTVLAVTGGDVLL